MPSWNVIALADPSHEYVEVSLCDFRFWKLQLVSYCVDYNDCLKILQDMGKMLCISWTWMLACAYKERKQKRTKKTKRQEKIQKERDIEDAWKVIFFLMSKLWQLSPSMWCIF